MYFVYRCRPIIKLYFAFKKSDDKIDYLSFNILFSELNNCSIVMVKIGQAKIPFATIEKMRKPSLLQPSP